MIPQLNEPKSKFDTRAVLDGARKLKSEVNYRPADKDAEKRCSECKYYVSPGDPQSDCAKVVGQVESYGVCDLWEMNPVGPVERSQQESTPTVSIAINMGSGPKGTVPNP